MSRTPAPPAAPSRAIKTTAARKPTETAKAEPSAAAAPRSVRVRPVPAVTRSIAVLRLLGRGNAPLGVKAIAQELGLVTSTCLHILRVLVDEGLVRVDAGTKRYSLGLGMLSLARSVIERNPFPQIAQPVLDGLAARWGVTAIGVEITGIEHMVVLAISRSQAPFRLHVDVGSRFPGLISATGRLVTAYADLPRDEIERRFQSLRWQQPPEFSTWIKEVEAVRRKGYSLDRGNYIAGVTLVAVPVFGERQRLTHALVAAGLSDAFDEARRKGLVEDMTQQARAVGESLA